MAEDNINEIVLKATIHYYCLNGMYRSMQSSALEGIRMYPGEQQYRFYYGISLAFEGRVQESIRELDLLNTHKDLMLASFLALIFAHRKCKVVDKEAITQLESKLRETRKSAKETALYFAGLFLLLSNRFDKAREYIDRMIKMSSNFKEGLILKGWLEVFSSKNTQDSLNHSALNYFDISGKNNDPEVILGKAKIFEVNGVFLSGVEILNHAIVLYPRFTPAYIEKIKLQTALKDWEQVVDTSLRSLSIDKYCIEAQRHLILHNLAIEGKDDQATSKLSDLFNSIELREPKNARLYFESGKLFARLSDHNNDVLHNTLSFIERAVFLDPEKLEYICEQAYQCMLLGRMSDAQRHYKTATQMDDKSINGLVGLLHCKIIEDEPVGEQLDSLEEFHKETGMSMELLYLLALTGQKRNKTIFEIQGYLEKIVVYQLEAIKGLPIGIPFFINLQPDFIINVVKLYLLYSPNEPIIHGQSIPTSLKQAEDLLSPLVTSCPSMKEPLYLMASIKYLCGDNHGAISLLNKCLDHNQSFSDGHLLMAKISEQQGNYQTASKSLEIALSHNFQIREQLQYIIIKASVLKKERKYEEALKMLKDALNNDKEKSNKKNKISKNDRISLYLQIVDIHSLLGQTVESEKILNEMLNEYKGTLDEGRILIANAQLAQARGDIDQALNVLKEITTEHGENFIRSRELMANIYLKYRKDRRLYASCYREILDKNPTTQSFLMLGDAYMNILEPERAIEIYEQALKKNPKDWVITRKVGQALIKTHFYEKAVTYYKAAIKTSGQNTFRYDLAELLYKMKRYDESKDIINSALEISESQGRDITNLEWECKLINLLAQVQLNTNEKNTAIETLKKAHNANQKLLRRLPIEQPDLLPGHKKFSISVCIQLAELISNYLRDHKQAIQIYKEALNYEDSNTDVLMALARLETLNYNYDLAHNYCTAILKHSPDMNEPILMMADLTFRQNDFDGALIHFNELLTRKPTYYPAMARYIEIARRIGKLEIVPDIFEKAEKYSSRAIIDTGYHYCKGLYFWYIGNTKQAMKYFNKVYWYIGNTSEAMKYFNKARQDNEIGVMATYHMIEICINPDNETIGGETFEEMDINSNSDPFAYEKINNRETAISTAEKLIAEIRLKIVDDLDYHIMSCFIMLAKKQKNEAEAALNEFTKILSTDKFKDNIAAILGVATAFMILKQTPKARNQLKRISKYPWNYNDAEYLERSWLLLADIYTQSGKYDLTTELLKRCLQYNKSCMKAYEYLGFIMEKEQSYKDAAQSYEKAWKFGNCNNPIIGYKLAFNYMKAKRYVDAIDVSKEILSKYPDYPKVRKEILDKCKQFLKT